ncbi:MAG TPA: TonB-dependent siderophore receptor [Methylibium sp.]|uniref:TonB-dependent siderophore receptor n=1 Tax=Methylibium sp. TaxID=2067992 RepID=UPI002DBBDE71|nr:TonB-dependent siderophore receptor [Methylibium sp.]HEU4457586.1 TonB-dependent siderophore receptor [Methylibium sp.]
MKSMARCVGAALFTVGTAAHAQTAPAPAEPAVSAPAETLPAVKAVESRDRDGYRARAQSSAGFVEQSLLDTPFQVNVFTERLMRDQVARSLIDIAKNDPAVTPSNAMPGYYDGVSIRGFELNNWSGYRREGLMFANQASQPVENKERLEIVKGLSALRYGFTNPGGIVNWVLKRPTTTPLAELTLQANEFGGFGAHADLGGPFGEAGQFGYRVNLVAEREATYVREVRGRRGMASGLFTWKVAPSLLAEFEIEHQKRELPQQVNVSFTSFATGVTPFLPTAAGAKTFLGQRWGTYPTEVTNTGGRLVWAFGDAWLVRSAVQFSDLWRDQQSAAIRAGSLQANGDFDVTTFYSPDQTRRALTHETVFEGRIETAGLKHELAFGVATMDHKVRFADSATPVLGTSNLFEPRAVPAPNVAPGSASVLRSRNRERGFFAADHVGFNEQWSAFVGLRHTTPSYSSFNTAGTETDRYDKQATTPSAGVIFKPWSQLALYASYAEGLEQGGSVPSTAANRDEIFLKPLESRQLELGAKADLLGGLALSGAVFKIDKGLEYLDAGSNRFVQDGRQVHRGVEISASGNVTRGLRVVGGVMALDPKVERTANAALVGKQPVNTAKRQASLFVDADVPAVPGLALSGGVFHSGRKPVDGANTLFVPSYARFDLGARFDTQSGARRTTLRAYLENVTDKTYFNSTSFGSMQFGSPRALRVSATTSF